MLTKTHIQKFRVSKILLKEINTFFQQGQHWSKVIVKKFELSINSTQESWKKKFP